jgi:uncharacterized protein involved in outer membrane biogenesis
MKKLKKLLLILVILVIVFIIAAVATVAFCLDGIVKEGVTTVAPKITQTTVTLDGVHISLMAGSVSLKNLVVGNPAGFKTPNAISLGKVAITVPPKSLLADKVVVHAIEIDNPEITFEGNPFGDNNLSKLMANVDSVSASTTPAPATTPGQPKAPAGPGKKLEVDDFLLTGAKVHATVPGLNQEITVPIPDIHFTDLGTGPDGITAAQLTQKVLREVTADTIKAVGDFAKNTLGKNADSLLKGGSSDLEKGAGTSVDQIKKGLGGLMGK